MIYTPFTKLPKSLLYGEEYTFIINKINGEINNRKNTYKNKSIIFCVC